MLLNVAFKFGISSEGEVEIILLSNETRTREEFIAGLGWHEIISHEKLFDPANKYWKDDSFTFVVEVRSFRLSLPFYISTYLLSAGAHNARQAGKHQRSKESCRADVQ